MKEAVYLSTNVFLSPSCHAAGNLHFHQAAALLLLSSPGLVRPTQPVSPMTAWVWHMGSGGKTGFVRLWGNTALCPALSPYRNAMGTVCSDWEWCRLVPIRGYALTTAVHTRANSTRQLLWSYGRYNGWSEAMIVIATAKQCGKKT